MSDLIESFRFALIVNSEISHEKEINNFKVPFPDLLQELNDYVNSPEYYKLIYEEQIKINKNIN